MFAPLILCSFPFAIANRLWGWSQGARFIGIALLMGSTGMFVASLGYEGWRLAGLVASAGLGFFLGRLHDGVRGTYGQKALRGLLYVGEPIGNALTTWHWQPLLIIPIFTALNGFIAWACSKLPVKDSTMIAEPLTGFALGGLNLGALWFVSH